MRIGELETQRGTRLTVHLEDDLLVIAGTCASGSVRSTLILDHDAAARLAELIAQSRQPSMF